MQTSYRLPADLDQDIDGYENDVQRLLEGDIAPGVFKAKRVPRGVYEQRRDGTYMVRVRIAGGTLTRAQAGTLAELAREFGNGSLHVTSRQDVQLHEVDIADTPTIMRRLKDVGLSSKGGGGNTVRNVTACPHAGVCPAECFDVTPYAHEVTGYLIALVGSYNLPRKYKIAFSGCAADCALARANDLGFIAAVKDGKPGFAVYAGGGMGTKSRLADRIEDWLPAGEAIRVAEALRRLFDRLGDRENRQRARLRFVFDRIGVDAVCDQLREERNVVTEEGVPDCRVRSELRTPGPAEVPKIEWVSGADRDLPIQAEQDPALATVPLHLPFGFVSADDLGRLADIAAEFSTEQGLRTTRSQDLLLRSVSRERLTALSTALGGLSIDVLAPTPLKRFVACAGASTCRLGLCLSRGAAQAAAEALENADLAEETVNALDIYVSGCPNSCGHHAIGPIGLFGVAQRSDNRLVPAYKVVLGARREEAQRHLGETVGTVPAKALPGFLLELAREFQAGRAKNESFVDHFERLGLEHFRNLARRHATVPAYAKNPDFYRDWGQDEDFSLAGRGAGECGTGVFEVIRDDIKEAKNALDALESGAETDAFAAFLPTVRALLMTRGIDTVDPARIIHAFETHFVDTNLVSDEFRALLSRARGRLEGWQDALVGQGAEVRRLFDRVELLFSTLDGTLQFHPPEAESADADTTGEKPADSEAPAPAEAVPAEPGPRASVELDLHGVTCPMTFVKAKLKLETISVGDTLAVTLDEGGPIQDVPASFRNEGQEIVSMTDLGNGQWRVVVKKLR